MFWQHIGGCTGQLDKRFVLCTWYVDCSLELLPLFVRVVMQLLYTFWTVFPVCLHWRCLKGFHFQTTTSMTQGIINSVFRTPFYISNKLATPPHTFSALYQRIILMMTQIGYTTCTCKRMETRRLTGQCKITCLYLLSVFELQKLTLCLHMQCLVADLVPCSVSLHQVAFTPCSFSPSRLHRFEEYNLILR